jgi:hypothetical protein
MYYLKFRLFKVQNLLNFTIILVIFHLNTFGKEEIKDLVKILLKIQILIMMLLNLFLNQNYEFLKQFCL